MMIDGPNSITSCEGGDPPCWSHLLEDDREDIVDRDDIERLVRNFYRDAAMDDLLGPVFEAARVNWNAHVATLIDVWVWQLLGEAGYEGQPLRAHEPVRARTPLRLVRPEKRPRTGPRRTDLASDVTDRRSVASRR